jgi:hypothetical protein
MLGSYDDMPAHITCVCSEKGKFCMTTFEENNYIMAFHCHLIFSTGIIDLCGREDGHLATLTGG